MKLLNVKFVPALALFVSLIAAADGAPKRVRTVDPKAARVVYTMVANADLHTFNNKNCQLVALMALDHQSVKIVRIDAPAGTLNASYVLEHPETVASAGINVILAKEFDLRARTVQSVRAQFDFDDRDKNMTIVAVLDTGEQLSKTRSMDAEFFRDHADHCLK